MSNVLITPIRTPVLSTTKRRCNLNATPNLKLDADFLQFFQKGGIALNVNSASLNVGRIV